MLKKLAQRATTMMSVNNHISNMPMKTNPPAHFIKMRHKSNWSKVFPRPGVFTRLREVLGGVIFLWNLHIHRIGDDRLGVATAYQPTFKLQPNCFVCPRIEPAKYTIVGPKHRIGAGLDSRNRTLKGRGNQARQLGAAGICDLHTKTRVVLEEIRHGQRSRCLICKHDSAHERQRSVAGIPSDAIRLNGKMDRYFWRRTAAETNHAPERANQK